jgi:endogenous inhibitor of DNA gyrase (YacG/DUF329 family)
MFEIGLEWSIASQYVLRSVGRGSTRDLAIYPAEGAKVARYRPLEQYPALYAVFTKLDGSKESCLQFAHKYGLLFADLTRPLGLGNDPGVLETLRNWKGYIKEVGEIIRRCELSRANPAEAFRRFGKKDKLLFGAEFHLSIKSSNSPATLDVRGTNLVGALELQAIQSILEGRTSFQCIECTRPFEVGAGARRSHSKFCSTRCKDSYHNRLKAEARRNHHA